ncbi:MAG: ATP-binding protein [Brumimicrobium sp.]
MKIAFTGPESSGKTSVSKEVAKRLQAEWFPEYAREYLLQRKGEYNFEDIETIALRQEEIRKGHVKPGLKLYDTEGIVLQIWSEFKYQRCAESIIDLVKSQDYTFYFLCSPKDIPWEEDPLRENPFQREELFDIYLKKIEELGLPFFVLEGTLDERIAKAIEIIQTL